MKITRREMLKASAAILASRSLIASGAVALEQALAGVGNVPVIWLQGNGCNGCSVSLLNSIYYTTIDDLLLNTIDLKFHPTMMAGAGDLATSAADCTLRVGSFSIMSAITSTNSSERFGANFRGCQGVCSQWRLHFERESPPGNGTLPVTV